jgi:RsiW-degrading membrane proteinase PrsW (M82 family)
VSFQWTALSAVTPSLLLMWYFHSRDIYPEPARVLWPTFGLGVLIIIPVLAVGLPARWAITGGSNALLIGLREGFLVAALPEEFCKLLVLGLYCARHRAFNEPMDGVIYGVAASLGFATLENLLYVAHGGMNAAFLRALTAVPSHAFLGAIMGYYVGQARFDPHRRASFLFKAWALPTLLHGLYDFPLLTLASMPSSERDLSSAHLIVIIGLMLFTILVLLWQWVWAIKVTRRLRIAQRQGSEAVPTMPQVSPAGGTATSEPMAQSIPTPAIPRVGAATGPSSWAWAYTLCGGLLAAGGGLMTLGIGLGITLGTVERLDLWAIVIGGSIIGVFPLIIGLFLFSRGIRRLNARPTPLAAASTSG